MLAGGGFTAQIACLGLASHLVVTLFATPRLMLWKKDTTPATTGITATAKEIIADELRPIQTGIKQLHKLSSTVCNHVFNTTGLGQVPKMAT